MPKFGSCGGCNQKIGNNSRKVFKCKDCLKLWHQRCIQTQFNFPLENWSCSDCVAIPELSQTDILLNADEDVEMVEYDEAVRSYS